MSIQYALVEIKSCPMADDICKAKVIAHLDAMMTRNVYGEQTTDINALLEEKCGLYSRGKYKGKLRGWAQMEVCTVGGWQRLGPGQGNGRVVRPGSILKLSIVDFNGKPYFTY